MIARSSGRTWLITGAPDCMGTAACAAGLFVALLLAQYGDTQRGADLIERRNCTLCHSIRGAGGGTAPDLSRRSPRDFTLATLAASVRNHGPAMWRAMSARNLPIPSLGPTEIADLYAYF